MFVLPCFPDICACGLLFIVGHGAWAYDTRFTALLLPPFLVYYSIHTPGWFLELPLVKFIGRVYGNIVEAFGQWPAKILLAGLGLYAGMYVGGLIR